MIPAFCGLSVLRCESVADEQKRNRQFEKEGETQ